MTTPDEPTWTEQEIDERANTLPPYVPPLPGIEPISQDPHLFDTEHAVGFGMPLAKAAVAGTAAAMITAATTLLGLGEHPANHNYVTVWYNANIARIGDGPWCDMGVTYEAGRSGNLNAVCGGPKKGFAYTPAHAAWFRSVGRWHAGLKGIKPGDVVFFNWSRRKSIDDIEHVGLVEHVYSDGTAATIECNISDACRREHRDSTYVVGYGRPNYTAQQQEDDMPEYVSLSMEKAQALKAGQATHAVFDVENSDKGKAHADGSFPGILSGGKNGTLFNIEVKTSGTAGTFTLIEVDPAKDYAKHKSDYAVHPIGESHTYVGLCDPGMHLYVEFTPTADGSASAVAKAHYWHR